MIDRLVNFLFGCHHRRLSRPTKALNKSGKPEGHPYVVCLDCGRHFMYDPRELRVGPEISKSS